MPGSGGITPEASNTASTAVVMEGRYPTLVLGSWFLVHGPRTPLQFRLCASTRALVAAGTGGGRIAHRKPPGRAAVSHGARPRRHRRSSGRTPALIRVPLACGGAGAAC